MCSVATNNKYRSLTFNGAPTDLCLEFLLQVLSLTAKWPVTSAMFQCLISKTLWKSEHWIHDKHQSQFAPLNPPLSIHASRPPPPPQTLQSDVAHPKNPILVAFGWCPFNHLFHFMEICGEVTPRSSFRDVMIREPQTVPHPTSHPPLYLLYFCFVYLKSV